MIVSAGLSPAWQQILVFDEIAAGEVNRATRAVTAASGKVLNAARTLTALGAAAEAVTVAGGPTGTAIRLSLEAEGIRHALVETSTWSRTCTTLIERANGTVTELVENAGPVSAGELELFAARFRAAAAAARAIAFLGSLPAGAPSSTYRDLAAGLDRPVVADVRGPELLELLAAAPLLVKPNRAELGRTLGMPVETDAEVIAAIGRLHALGARWVVVTSGAGAVIAAGEGEVLRFEPSASAAVNPIGCGDAMTAGIAAAIAAGDPVPEAVALGIACAAENLRTLVPGAIDGAAARALAATVRPRPIG